ncbi:hypothetical protein [Pseudomonas sp. Tri1]|uniref:hypothetical protein n=1 Tax=Pseudomonas sp. Tri1 TaxID=2823875 RepID=UPI001B32AF6D|nr:hypothetical protein [Pseudomonas sp. Tri1]
MAGKGAENGQKPSLSVYESRGDSLGFVTNILAAKIAVLAQEIGDRQVTPRDGKNGVLDAQLSALDTATVDGVPLNSRKRSMG